MSIEQQVIQFLKDSHINSDIEIGLHQDLYETGIIDSLKTMELVMFIEGLRGEPVDLADITPEKLKSVAIISTHFLAQAA